MTAPFTFSWRESGSIYERELRSVRDIEGWLRSFRSPASVCDASGELVGEVHDRTQTYQPHQQRWRWWLRV